MSQSTTDFLDEDDKSIMVDIKKLGRICCLTLTNLLGEHKVTVPGSASYNASLQSYFTAQETATQPACIVAPQTAQDVASAVKCLTAQETACSFAVRSGGHTYWAGAANIADGVVLDLRALNTVELNADRSVVMVGTGTSWDVVYAKLDPHGLSVNGGRAAGVGVGGLTLGGGISYFSPRYGWTCDTVTNFQVVLADGSIVDANASSHADLFFALKGGNNNFGIVTRIDLATFRQGLVWGATLYNRFSVVDDVIREFVKVNSRDAYDEYATYFTTFGYSQAQGMGIISSQMQYTKDVEGTPPVYEGYLSLPNVLLTTSTTNVTALSQQTAALQPTHPRALYRVCTLLSTEQVIKELYNQWNASLPSITNVTGILWAFVMEPLPPAFYARHATTNALGLSNRSESLFIGLLSVTWVNESDDDVVADAADKLMAAIEQGMAGIDGALDPFIYLDYAGQFQDPIRSYGPESVQVLTAVREKYDPNKVFTLQVPGGYKVPYM